MGGEQQNLIARYVSTNCEADSGFGLAGTSCEVQVSVDARKAIRSVTWRLWTIQAESKRRAVVARACQACTATF